MSDKPATVIETDKIETRSHLESLESTLEIGHGSFGKVFLARAKDEKQYALKIVKLKDLRYKKYIEGEINVMVQLRDIDHFLRLEWCGISNNIYYFQLEYCEQGDLSAYLAKLKDEDKISKDLLLDLIRQIIEGFAVLHQKGFMHRDVKPENILVTNGRTKIADFGLSKPVGNDGIANSVLGSRCTMAPEVLGNTGYSYLADIYSVGLLFYYMYEYTYPKEQTQRFDLLKLKNRQPASKLSFQYKSPFIIPEIKQMIEDMTSISPSQRPNAQTLLQRITTIIESNRAQEESEKIEQPAFNLSEINQGFQQHSFGVSHLPEPITQEKGNSSEINLQNQASNTSENEQSFSIDVSLSGLEESDAQVLYTLPPNKQILPTPTMFMDQNNNTVLNQQNYTMLDEIFDQLDVDDLLASGISIGMSSVFTSQFLGGGSLKGNSTGRHYFFEKEAYVKFLGEDITRQSLGSQFNDTSVIIVRTDTLDNRELEGYQLVVNSAIQMKKFRKQLEWMKIQLSIDAKELLNESDQRMLWEMWDELICEDLSSIETELSDELIRRVMSKYSDKDSQVKQLLHEIDLLIVEISKHLVRKSYFNRATKLLQIEKLTEKITSTLYEQGEATAMLQVLLYNLFQVAKCYQDFELFSFDDFNQATQNKSKARDFYSLLTTRSFQF